MIAMLNTLEHISTNCIAMNDAEFMKSIRESLHLTQKEMAKLLGYAGQKDISRIETGAENMSSQTRAHLRTIEANLEAIKHQL